MQDNVVEFHQDDYCDLCGATMDMWRTRHEDTQMDFLEWICTNDACGERESRDEPLTPCNKE